MTAKEFLLSGFEFSEAEKRALKRSNELCNKQSKDIITFSYKEVKETFVTLLRKGEVVKVCSLILGVTEKRILNSNHKDFVYFTMWLADEYKMIEKIEKELESEPDADLETAGIKDMQRYGNINVIDALAGGDVTKWDAVEKLPYEQIYVKLHKTKTENEIKEMLHEIKKSKTK